jgi:hypothetical protein
MPRSATADLGGGVVLMDSATGSDFVLDTALAVRATVGETIQPLPAGPTEYWDEGSVIEVKLYAGELASATPDTTGHRVQVNAGYDIVAYRAVL